MSSPSPIAALREHLGMTLREFGQVVGVQSVGNLSIMERTGQCSLNVALRIEQLGHQRGFPVDAAEICENVRKSRVSVAAGSAGQGRTSEAAAA